MKKSSSLIAAQSFIIFSTLALASVSIMAISNPQSVMDLVKLKLENNDAISSIRGLYGGLGLAIVISLVYFARKDAFKGLVFLSMLWCFYALSRLITTLVDGSLGVFGRNWMAIESVLCVIGLCLIYLQRKDHEVIQ